MKIQLSFPPFGLTAYPREALWSFKQEMLCIAFAATVTAMAYAVFYGAASFGFLQGSYIAQSDAIQLRLDSRLWWAFGAMVLFATLWFSDLRIRNRMFREASPVSSAEIEAAADGCRLELAFVTDLSSPILLPVGRQYSAWHAIAVWRKKDGTFAVRPVYGKGHDKLHAFRFFEAFGPLEKPMILGEAQASPANSEKPEGSA